MSTNNKVVLAFSGGLDTSYCVKYLADEKGLEVHSATVDTGGFSARELEEIEAKARRLGVKSHVLLNEVSGYYKNGIRFLIYGNVLRNNTYPLSVSAERAFQAQAISNYAKEIGASYIAHGSTGAGNDQVRFDLVFQIQNADVEVLTPIRDQQLSRQQEIDYLESKGVKQDFTKAHYSINQGIWGTSIGGKETLTSHLPLPESAFPTQIQRKDSEELCLQFSRGELTGVNDQYFEDPTDAIRRVQVIASPFGIGRDIHVGDTIIGIKGRVGFEAAAPMIIIKGHQALEKHVLTKWQVYWKDQLATWYGMLMHEGQFLEPVMRNIEEFLESTQEFVTGKVFVQLQPYDFKINGVESKHDLMASGFGDYGEMNRNWSGEDVKGFTKILSNQTKIFHSVNQLNND